MKTKKKRKYILPKPPKIDPNRPAWAHGMTPAQELETHRAYLRQLAHQCGTDDVDVISAAVRRIKKISCTRCGQTVEANAVGDKHHITENHVCEITQPTKFTLRF